MKTANKILRYKFLNIIFILFSSIIVLSVSSDYCEKQEDCGDFMICLNNECLCDDSSETFSDYDEDNTPQFLQNYKTTCRRSALIGEHCDNRTTVCMRDSICTSEGICKCPPDLEETKLNPECTRPYDYPCNETQLCNAEKFLSCRRDDDLKAKRVCRCHNEIEMIFDHLKNSCVGRIGYPCDLMKWMNLQLGCVGNSHCSKTDSIEEFYGVCQCNSGFVQLDSSSNKCESIYGKSCLQLPDPSCADGFNLECVQNTCQCKSGSIFDPTDQECKLVSGTLCEQTENKCVENAGCRLNNGPEFKLMCQCSPEYLPTSTGLCQLGPFAEEINCSNVNPCHSESGLKCVKSLCQCDEGLVFDTLTKSCIGVHGGVCSSFGTNCTRHSFCNKESICQCNNSFHPTEEGYCVAGYGAGCSLEDDEVRQICSLERGLSCQVVQNNQTRGRGNDTGMCSCVEDNTIFDKEAGRCLLRLGEHCSPPSKRCVTNAFCGANQNCQCYSRYSPTPDGNCMLDYLESCNTSDSILKECNTYLGLECINFICNCSLGMIYNHTDSICLNVTLVIDIKAISDQVINDLEIFSTTPSMIEEELTRVTERTNLNEDDNSTSAKNSFTSLLVFYTLVIFIVVIFAVVLKRRIQQKYYCLAS